MIIAIVDCGMGNLHSVVHGFLRVNADIDLRITDQIKDIERADKVVFPGDGNFGACCIAIESRGLRSVLIDAAKTKPFFAICVGMQVLFAHSEESECVGLGIWDSTVYRLPSTKNHKVPHIGWNSTHHYQSSTMTNNIEEESYFYFIHSYYVPIGDYTLMSTHHGIDISAVVGQNLLLATQFHPEKSGVAGKRLLENFVRL